METTKMQQPSQAAHPMLINIPQPPPSNPDTPSDMPGTPTSTTTSLSTLSTTAIKDGHRGHAQHNGPHRGHQSQASTNSLEAERADRISRLAGLSNLTALRGGPNPNAQTTPTSGNFGQNAPTAPAYFDANGQPVASTKMSTVGTASATSSGDGRTLDGGDREMMDDVEDEDMRSMDTNFRTNDSVSVGGGISSIGGGGSRSAIGGGGARSEALDPMDEDLATRSVGGFDDRMSDDGNASLVGFGEGAGSTVSGPIYQRRPVPGTSSAGAMAFARWQLERSSSGISDTSAAGGVAASTTATAGSGSTSTAPAARRDTVRQVALPDAGVSDMPLAASAAQERQDARMVGGVATDGAAKTGVAPGDDDVFVDTSTRSPLPISQSQQHGDLSHRQQTLQQTHQPTSPTSREAAERIFQRLNEEDSRVGGSGPVLESAGTSGDRLGQFYFEK
ncbi:hypothetical protein PpBr36_04802 [Pyricularia pennisetigena]|uniref:hypothetical protein n=1 Tax=Pyricularia pennisetigena TaxID=1578925 RepID=UPI00115318E0|nr:hypothetical protein PpBr36_04802 [Pyricularia pennisetigena]TLS26806.1 hypothetical protein PpBr36_04802 [Pyricularia pennisetigena]